MHSRISVKAEIREFLLFVPMPQLFTSLQLYVDGLIQEFDQIPAERKVLLSNLTHYIQSCINQRKEVALTFICTHNSRRSHLSQIWAQTAAFYYAILNVSTYSGGTEATAFNPRAVKAIKKAGFQVEAEDDTDNPVYLVRFAADQTPIKAFSKIYDQGGNPFRHFGAVMTCTHADENCPYIPEATRISLPFDDPKAFDDTPLEETKYEERTRQIGREIFFAFSLVKVSE
ncbi:protein-tyrosine-phosphatase [Cytophagaceae bacterium YF14B1]|uniref:Protein-tyrosine-phosphatase n=1 Tax=Xanthocytophaga flava TaxID=3048013 RepID=A0AAE3U7J3_9BACT|nr:protein-tyrosine-phosphatase [Xanthocytophaga flavus]MDJ1482999.1 protein-tyrosine-phosphatase [Xanthocytophaga flavus]